MSDLHLTYCCPACQRVKGQRADGSMDQEWSTMAEYVTRYPATRHNALISEFYCSDCSTSYDRLVQYGRTSPSCFF